jgi:ABC-2 type transport system ATP-binding protein
VRQDSGTTVFLTTHYLDEAEEADTICIISKGQIVSFGTPEQVKSELVEKYLLIDADNRDALRAELIRLNIAFTETPQFKINLNGSSGHKLLKSIDTPLTTLKTHNPSLEDAYLSIVEER